MALKEENWTCLFCKNYNSQFILVQLYVDDIIFGATNETLCEDFSKLMQTKFEMSMMEELMFFLGLQKIANKQWNLHSPNQVCEKTSKEVQHGQ